MTGLEVSAAAQARALVAAFAFGILLAVLYDVLRILRTLFGIETGGKVGDRLSRLRFPLLSSHCSKVRTGKSRARLLVALTVLLDFLYALFSGILLLLFVYWQNDGIFRLYYPIAAALGFLCYFYTVGRLFCAFTATLVFFLRILLGYLALFVRLPILFCLRTLRRVAVWLGMMMYRPLYGRIAAANCKKQARSAFLPRNILGQNQKAA